MNLTVNCLTVEFHLVHYISHLTKKIYWILQIEASLNPHTVGNQASLPSAFPDASAWLHDCLSHTYAAMDCKVQKLQYIKWGTYGKKLALKIKAYWKDLSCPQKTTAATCSYYPNKLIPACLGIFGIFGTDSITIHNLRHYCCDIILWQCWRLANCPQAQRSSNPCMFVLLLRRHGPKTGSSKIEECRANSGQKR